MTQDEYVRLSNKVRLMSALILIEQVLPNNDRAWGVSNAEHIAIERPLRRLIKKITDQDIPQFMNREESDEKTA